MYWLVCDETNTDPNQGDFFIYGGLLLSDQQLLELHRAVIDVRAKHGYLPGDQLKFQTAARPPHVTIAAAKQAKQDVLEAAHSLGVRLIAYVILHRIAGTDGKRRMEFSMNTMMATYHRFLELENAHGVVSIDRVDESYAFDHLQRLFQTGLELESGMTISLDDRILYLGMTSNNASHVSSVVDIAIGGFRYCVNTAGGQGNTDVAGTIFPTLARMMWAREVGGTRHIGGFGYLERPKKVGHPPYSEKYAALRDALTTYSDAEATEATEAPEAELP